MRSHKPIFVISFLIAAGIYSGLYAAAPHILLLSSNAKVQGITKIFHVDIRNDLVESRNDNPLDQALEWSTRPGTIRELLNRETEMLPPLPLDERFVPAEVPELASRATDNEPVRDYDLERNSDIFQGIDTQILEIAEATARNDIEITRRLVKQVTTRILDRNELPVLGGVASGVPYRIADASTPSIDDGTKTSESPSPQPDALSIMEAIDNEIWGNEVDTTPGLFPGTSTLEMPIELVAAHELVRQEIAQTSPFESMDELVDLEVSTYIDPKTGQGFFQVIIRPGKDQEIEVLPKDITFVVDASNSITQHKLNVTARGIVSSLAYLHSQDRFNIVVFRDSPTFFNDEFQKPTPEVLDSAKDFLFSLETRGSTDLYKAIGPVIAQAPRSGSPGIVVVISDGRPTGGNLAGRDLINTLSDENIHGNTIYTFGGGKTVNTYLLDLLAYRNKGTSYTTNRIDDIDEHLPRFVALLRDAILVNIRGDFGRIREETIFPKRIPDFFHGREVSLYGKFDPLKDSYMVLRLRGDAGSEHKDMILRAELSTSSTGDREIARRWAFEKVYYLIGEISRLGETPELMDALGKLSREYNISSVYQPR